MVHRRSATSRGDASTAAGPGVAVGITTHHSDSIEQLEPMPGCGDAKLSGSRASGSGEPSRLSHLGTFRLYRPSFAATIFSTSKMAMELANPVSAS
jgi:hypothetical protein